LASLRPYQYRRAAFGLVHDKRIFFELSPPIEGHVGLYVCVGEDGPDDDGNPQSVNHLLLRVSADMLTMFPLNIRPDGDEVFSFKYGKLQSIAVTPRVDYPFELPKNLDDVEALLEHLPDGFSKDLRAGLGLLGEYRFIGRAVAQVPDVTELVVHGGGARDESRIDGERFYIGQQRFEKLLRAARSTASRHQRRARVEKAYLAHESLLHVADPLRFPARRAPVEKDAIADQTSVGRRNIKLSKRDQAAVVDLIQGNVEQIAREKPTQLLTLKSDIERVSLLELVGKLQAMLGKSLTESQWQAFFSINPFVLSMAFPSPAMVVGQQQYVGGARVDRGGSKLADFLLKSGSTGNLLVVEIKKPDTPLLSKAYRDGVFGLSSEMSGAITQTLHQRSRLQTELPLLKYRGGLDADATGYSIRCVLLAGTVPTEVCEQESFELVRNALAGIVIVTFDELLGRLQELAKAMNPSLPSTPYEAPF